LSCTPHQLAQWLPPIKAAALHLNSSMQQIYEESYNLSRHWVTSETSEHPSDSTSTRPGKSRPIGKNLPSRLGQAQLEMRDPSFAKPARQREREDEGGSPTFHLTGDHSCHR
jgi:hypothetical protein